MKASLFSLLILLSLTIGLAVPTSQVAANQELLSDNSAPVNCKEIVECDYINLHNRTAMGFTTNISYTPLPVSANFEHQPIYGYIQMHTYPEVRVAGVSTIIPVTGARKPATSNLASLEGQPIYGYLSLHNRSTGGPTSNAAVSPLSTSPAFTQMPVYGYLQMHSHE